MDSFADFLLDILEGLGGKSERLVFDTVGQYCVSTVSFSRFYETAVNKNGRAWVIVARYKTEEEALKGHEDWMAACALNPVAALDVMINEYVKF